MGTECQERGHHHPKCEAMTDPNVTDEELAALHKARVKLNEPDAPQNQIESKPAIDAEVLESEAAKA